MCQDEYTIPADMYLAISLAEQYERYILLGRRETSNKVSATDEIWIRHHWGFYPQVICYSKYAERVFKVQGWSTELTIARLFMRDLPEISFATTLIVVPSCQEKRERVWWR